jgi:hypothetical protein
MQTFDTHADIHAYYMHEMSVSAICGALVLYTYAYT